MYPPPVKIIQVRINFPLRKEYGLTTSSCIRIRLEIHASSLLIPFSSVCVVSFLFISCTCVFIQFDRFTNKMKKKHQCRCSILFYYKLKVIRNRMLNVSYYYLSFISFPGVYNIMSKQKSVNFFL